MKHFHIRPEFIEVDAEDCGALTHCDFCDASASFERFDPDINLWRGYCDSHAIEHSRWLEAADPPTLLKAAREALIVLRDQHSALAPHCAGGCPDIHAMDALEAAIREAEGGELHAEDIDHERIRRRLFSGGCL